MGTAAGSGHGGGRSVVITGATGGIGRATAVRLAARGWDVIGTARTRAKADDLVGRAAASGIDLRAVVLDVADADSCRQAVAQVEEMTGGGPWALVNNAGVPQAGALRDVDDEQARHVLEVNLVGVMRLCRLTLPGMAERGTGRIVNVSSGLGRVPWPMGGWYSAGKHALSALTHCLRIETAHLGVKVCLVEPGAFATAMLDRAVDDLARARAGGAGPGPGRGPGLGYDRSTRLFSNVNRYVPGPEPVAGTIEHCLSARRPRPRCVVGHDARLLVPLHTVLPLRLTDLVKHAAAGLPRAAAAVRAATTAQAATTVRAAADEGTS
ncbi:SDR family oxidoreductase [Kitasatospora sp. NPDC051914]|uniref:SDR family oxidoreductase n=1 Tax=Kitasatospora sp. NPDC051914 TaxID=3154945 RepID=UPI00343061B2